MIKTMQASDKDFQDLIATVERNQSGRIDLFEHPDVTDYGNPRQERARTRSGILRAIRRAQYRGQMTALVEVTADGYRITSYTGLRKDEQK